MTKIFGQYKTYSFVDKDPVIDELRTLIGRQKVKLQDLAEASGVNKNTIARWLYGDTKRPQHATLRAVVRTMGYDFTLVARQPAKVVQLRKRA